MKEKLNVGLIVTLSGRWPRELPIQRHREYTAWAEEKLTDMQCLPDSLADRRYYLPTEQGKEGRFKTRLEQIRAWKKAQKEKK